jgi:NADPH:quinone reductase-like Zn-dependent oxidoreductase
MLMKAVRVHAFTQRPDDIRIDEVPLLEPAHGQIRVRMLMCPVHPSDFHYVRGIYYQALEPGANRCRSARLLRPRPQQ